MLEFAKLVHDAIGIENPRTFIAVFALVGFLLFGTVGWLLDRGYRAQIRNESQKATPAHASFSVKDVTEFGGVSLEGYKIYQSLSLNEFSNGIDGSLLILIDERINGLTGEVRNDAYSNVQHLQITLDGQRWFLPQRDVKQALLLVVDRDLKTVYYEQLGRESARLDRVFLYPDKSRPTFILTRDYSTGMGSYNGPISYFFEVSKSGISYILPQGVMDSLKSAWAIVHWGGQSSDILYKTCRPAAWQKADSSVTFVVAYKRFRLREGEWTPEPHEETGFWESVANREASTAAGIDPREFEAKFAGDATNDSA
jgi:hypothetical protein